MGFAPTLETCSYMHRVAGALIHGRRNAGALRVVYIYIYIYIHTHGGVVTPLNTHTHTHTQIRTCARRRMSAENTCTLRRHPMQTLISCYCPHQANGSKRGMLNSDVPLAPTYKELAPAKISTGATATNGVSLNTHLRLRILPRQICIFQKRTPPPRRIALEF